MFNNLLFCALCFTVLWGTWFPKISEWVQVKIVYDQALLTSATALTHAVGTHKRVKGLRCYWRTLVAGEVWMA